MTLNADALAIAYLISAVLFILGLKGLTHPASARRGNIYAIIGMAIAVVATLMSPAVQSYTLTLIGLAIGAVIGTIVALRINMTALPQLVAALHSFVGLAAVLVAIGAYLIHREEGMGAILRLEIVLGSLIGAVTFTGSVVAFGKLQGIITSTPLQFRGQHWFNLLLALAMLALVGVFVVQADMASLLLVTAIAFLLGVLLIMPIGGADMPVVVSMLNSYSGWAAAATGFTLGNHLLIITGALVGFSGAILSYIMCRAMNRSIINVVFGG
ncbi:MAG: NAD synthetase, partial [Gammaproteobacteria bacterium]